MPCSPRRTRAGASFARAPGGVGFGARSAVLQTCAGAGRPGRRKLLGRQGDASPDDHVALEFKDVDGHPAGVVFAGLDLDWLSEHLRERGLSPTSSILIADREGNIVARLPHPGALIGKNMRKSHEAIMDGNTAGWEEAVGVDGVTRIFGYVPPALPPRDFFLTPGNQKPRPSPPLTTPPSAASR